ncbi:MAG TPA: hypothetical protein VEU08_24625, partial [Vicinamibacterales bacterium]|nr:hypothetical protein [Vicinamibacterales bacterium]
MLISVAVPVPALDLLTYSVPDGASAPVGARVVVPLGARRVTGLVVAHNAAADGHAVKPVVQVLDRESFVPPELIALAQWTADYYACGVGDAIPALLPPMARGARVDAHKTVRVASLTAAGQEVARGLQPSVPNGPSAKQVEALALLAGAPDGIATPDLARRGLGADVIARLAKRGYVSLRNDRIDRDPFQDTGRTAVVPGWDRSPTAVRALTSEQDAALNRLLKLSAAGDFRVALVHGV